MFSKHLSLYEVILGVLILSLVQFSFVVAQEEEEQQGAVPVGNVVNSKYLSIPEHRYRIGDFSDQITGTVVNNSTQEISGISVDAALYDNADRLITMAGAGFADVSTLPPGDNSAFSISIFGVEEEIDHYTLFPSGTP